MLDFMKAHKGKLIAVAGVILIEAGSYLTGSHDILTALSAVVSSIVGS